MAKNTAKQTTDKKTKEEIRKSLMSKLSRYYGIAHDEASYDQIYRATLLSVKDILAEKKKERDRKYIERKNNDKRMGNNTKNK